MLALPPSDPELSHNGSKVFRGFTMHDEFKKTIECAGHHFEEFYRTMVLGHKKESKVEEESKNQGGPAGRKNAEKKSDNKTAKNPINDLSIEDSYYTLLGLPDFAIGVTENELKKAYRNTALVHHPDKLDGKTTPLWLRIQRGYETLIDEKKRQKYDSTLPFEDEVPEGPVAEKEFFNVFTPVFIRNAFWSNKKTMPEIGDMTSDIKTVEKFYAFWDNFDSWRDFAVGEENESDRVESRYERRHQEKENKKEKEVHLKKERQRIMRLVENARLNDPRLIKIRKEQEEAANKIKQEKQGKRDKLKQDKEDLKKKEEEAKLKVLQEKAEADKKIAEEKKNRAAELRQAIKELKTVFAEKIDHPDYDKFWLDEFMERLKYEDKVALTNTLKNTPMDDCIDELVVYIRKFDKTLERRSKDLVKPTKVAEKVIEKKQVEEPKKKKEDGWTVEDLSLLAKGLAKFPSGTQNRWGSVARFMGNKTADQVLSKSKELAKTANNKATTEKLNNEAFEQVKKHGMKDVGHEADTRAVYDQTKFTGKEKEENKNAEKPAESATAVLLDDGWSQEEQKKLEDALREFPATLEAGERWAKVAEKVGKTKKQCIDRFKVLRDAIKNGGK